MRYERNFLSLAYNGYFVRHVFLYLLTYAFGLQEACYNSFPNKTFIAIDKRVVRAFSEGIARSFSLAGNRACLNRGEKSIG
jgi:hypothetical protein